jgi:hypothetical protein
MTQRSKWMEKQREKQAEYQADYRFNQAGGGADKQLVADGGPGADDAAQRVEKQRVEKQREDLDYRFNRAGGGADKQLVVDGGPGADDAAQRVALRRATEAAYTRELRRLQRVAMEAGGAEQLLAAAITLSPAKLAAKSGSYVAAALSAGGAEQLVAAATTLSRAELVDKPYMYLHAMARASERCAGADGVTDGIYKGFTGSTKQVLADYIVKIRQGELLANQQGRLGALLAKQQGEIQLLLASFSLSKVGL